MSQIAAYISIVAAYISNRNTSFLLMFKIIHNIQIKTIIKCKNTLQTKKKKTVEIQEIIAFNIFHNLQEHRVFLNKIMK